MKAHTNRLRFPILLPLWLAVLAASLLAAVITVLADPASAQQPPPDNKPKLIVSATTLTLTETEVERHDEGNPEEDVVWTTYTLYFDRNPAEIGDVDGDGNDDLECGGTAWVYVAGHSGSDIEFRYEQDGVQFSTGEECTGGNWGSPKILRLRAVADADMATDPPVTLTHEVWGKDAKTVLTTSENPTVAVSIIEKDRTEPAVSIVADGNIDEGEPAVFTLRRINHVEASQLTVDVNVSETGSALTDPPGATTQVQFAAFQAETTLTLGTDNDNVVEGDVTVTATITAPSGYEIAGDASATVTVADDDEARFSTSVDPTRIAEGQSSTLTVSTSNGVTFAEDQTITLDFTDSTAAAADYTVNPDTLTLQAGQSTVSATITAVDDEDNEPIERILIAAKHGTADIGHQQTITIEASDADAAVPVFSATLTVGEVVDGDSTFIGYDSMLGALSPSTFVLNGVTLTVANLELETIGSSTTLLLRVTPSLATGFALALGGQPFRPSDENASGTLSSYNWSDPGLNWSTGETVDVKLYVFEPGLLSIGMSEITGSDANATVETDNANGSTVHLRYRSDGATEWLAPNPAMRAVTPDLKTPSFPLTNLTNGATYEVQASLSASFPTGEIVSTIFTAGDTVSYESQTYTVTEGGEVTVPVMLSLSATGEVRVQITFGGNAEPGDYTITGLVDNNVLVFAVGEDLKSFTIQTQRDSDRNDETISLGFGTITGAVAGSPSTATITIDDTTPSSSSPPSGNGGGGGGPVFSEGPSATRSIPENTAGGEDIGDPITATGAALEYSLSGDDAAAFDIVADTGQLQTKSALDYETKNAYAVTVTATNTSGSSAEIDVTIDVIDVDEAPELTGPASVDHPENGEDPPAAYVAEDPEGDAVAWSLSGDDAGAFTITDGVLAFKEPPDHEAPADADGDNVYSVAVAASDANSVATIDVFIIVTDVDEPGTVTLSSDSPTVGAELSAALADPDGGITDAAWSWERSPDQTTWTPVGDASSSTYTPVAADAEHYLRAEARYADGEGPDKLAQGISANPVVETGAAVLLVLNPTELEAAPGPDLGEVEMTWIAATAATAHWVWSEKKWVWSEKKEDGADGKWNRGQAGSAVIGGLEAGQTYWFVVIENLARPGEEPRWTESSNWAQAFARNSLDPTRLSAAPGDNSGEIALTWAPAPNATAHWVWSVKDDGTDGKWNRGQAGSAVIGGLEAGQTYWFVVIENLARPGEEPRWTESSNWAQAFAGDSLDPTRLSAAPGDNSGEIALTWIAASDATAHWVWSVKVDSSGGKWTVGQAGSAVVGNLEAGQVYWFVVIERLVSRDGTPRWSELSNWVRSSPQR